MLIVLSVNPAKRTFPVHGFFEIHQIVISISITNPYTGDKGIIPWLVQACTADKLSQTVVKTVNDLISAKQRD
jgi:hypothetical protein